MSAVNFDSVAEDPELFAARKASARRARKLLGGAAQTQDIDHDIRGSLWAGHAEELPGFEGVYFNPGADPSSPEWFNVQGKKVGGNAQWLDAYNKGGYASRASSGGAGGAGGAGGGAPTLPGGGASSGSLAGDIESLLRSGMAGGTSRYGDDTVGRMKGSAFEVRKAQQTANEEAIDEDAARSGMVYSGQRTAQQGANRRAASEGYAQDVSGILNQKANADYEDKMHALEDSMKYVEQDETYRLGLARNDIERERIQSEAALAREKIQAESDMLDRQLSAQEAASNRAASSAARGQSSSQQFNRQMAELRHGWDVENRDYEMPFRLGNLGLQYNG